jgi:hypothetical protein
MFRKAILMVAIFLVFVAAIAVVVLEAVLIVAVLIVAVLVVAVFVEAILVETILVEPSASYAPPLSRGSFCLLYTGQGPASLQWPERGAAKLPQT